jgi:hypothetical protein
VKCKLCCHSKGFKFVEEDDGTVLKSLPMSDDVRTMLETQRRECIQKPGREPGPNDSIFFDLLL